MGGRSVPLTPLTDARWFAGPVVEGMGLEGLMGSLKHKCYRTGY